MERSPIWVRLWETESRRAVLWLPVLMGAGIWVYFALPFEPAPWSAALGLVPPAALLAARRGRGSGWGGLALGLALLAVASGYALALVAAHRAAAPVLAGEIEETIEGRVRELSASRGGAARVLLDRVVIYGLPPQDWPARVRVTLLDSDPSEAPRPGDWIRVYATLMPPGGPVEPGAHDFRLGSWFLRLGAVGYAHGYFDPLPPPAEPGLGERAVVGIERLRQDLTDAIRAALPGTTGAFAAALITGDRATIPEADAEALRISSLAHLLSISGLHMSILTGLVFGFARLLFALVPGVALRYPAKKWAAVAALAAGTAYLLISGMTVPTQRSYVMVAVALTAVMLDRPALSLRALALSAAIVLALMPSSLLDVGFQMSFAATAALLAGYEALRDRRLAAIEAGPVAARAPKPGLARRAGLWLAAYAGGLVLTSLLAGLATGPYAAFHFNRTGPWGLAANFAAVPLMGVWIAPAAILAAVAAPFGLAEWPLRLMGWGIDAVMWVAHEVASWPLAEQFVPAAPGAVLGLVTLGGLWLCLWRGAWRLLGAAPVALALALWAFAPPRPELLIAAGGGLVGLMGPEGRALDRARGEGFAAENWLRRDGDAAEQEAAAARPGLERGRGFASGVLSNGWRLETLTGRDPAPETMARFCTARTLLVVPRARAAPPGDCVFLGPADLRRALAVHPEGTGIRIEAAGAAGRLWSPEG